ncbi:hypothetical protein HYV31_00090 [candidate division WWE3 bacterium]|nr:hypothetical protein [candidate division WWE3 bacterium]
MLINMEQVVRVANIFDNLGQVFLASVFFSILGAIMHMLYLDCYLLYLHGFHQFYWKELKLNITLNNIETLLAYITGALILLIGLLMVLLAKKQGKLD